MREHRAELIAIAITFIVLPLLERIVACPDLVLCAKSQFQDSTHIFPPPPPPPSPRTTCCARRRSHCRSLKAHTASGCSSSGAHWCARWTACQTAAFKDAAARVWTEEQRAPTEEVVEKTMPHAQRLVNRHQQDAQLERLMAMFNMHDPHSLKGAQAAARIRSCSGGAVSAYLEVLPLTHKLRMANFHLTCALRFRNGIQILPADNAGKRCPCGDMLCGMRNADDALTLPKHSGHRMLRHDYLNKVWCDAARCAGVASVVAPKLRELQMQPGVRRHENAHEDARGDALLAMPEGMLVIHVNVVHALAVTYLQGMVAAGKSAEVDSAAAAMREHKNEDEYRHDIDGGAYEWEPVVIKSGGRLGKGATRVINRLAKIASESDGVEKHVFVRRVQEALSVARVQGNGWVWKKGLQAMAYGVVRCFQEGYGQPTDDVG